MSRYLIIIWLVMIAGTAGASVTVSPNGTPTNPGMIRYTKPGASPVLTYWLQNTTHQPQTVILKPELIGKTIYLAPHRLQTAIDLNQNGEWDAGDRKTTTVEVLPQMMQTLFLKVYIPIYATMGDSLLVNLIATAGDHTDQDNVAVLRLQTISAPPVKPPVTLPELPYDVQEQTITDSSGTEKVFIIEIPLEDVPDSVPEHLPEIFSDSLLPARKDSFPPAKGNTSAPQTFRHYQAPAVDSPWKDMYFWLLIGGILLFLVVFGGIASNSNFRSRFLG
ncbi:MAG: hypothetical protein D6675_14440 [Gemmatimonadetes bacterium]|nr:MAG: hypothetical protein D6675_14440 [Gemmatimonadota bacterium]